MLMMTKTNSLANRINPTRISCVKFFGSLFARARYAIG